MAGMTCSSLAAVLLLTGEESLGQATGSCTNPACRNESGIVNKKFYRTYWSLTQVPQDIPVEALEVYLTGNAITSLAPGVFSKLTQCVRLDLDKNQLSSLSKDSLSGLKSLQTLNLQNNKVSVIEPGTFDHLSQCLLLSLDNNDITTIPTGLFYHMILCESLSLARNQITILKTGAFDGLQSLKHLSLENNQISSITDGAFDSLFSINTIRLFRNRLRTLSPDVFINLPRHPLELALSWELEEYTNQWDCSSLCWLKHEEHHKSVEWWYFRKSYPRCTVGGNWSSLQCGDPGGYFSASVVMATHLECNFEKFCFLKLSPVNFMLLKT